MTRVLILLLIFTIFSCSFDDNNSVNNLEESTFYPVEVTDYFQTPGFYSNYSNFSLKENLDKVLGAPIGGGTYAPDLSSIVTLGEPGGYVVVEFDPPIENHPDNIDGYDFIVFGNSLWWNGDPKYPDIEFGVVEVEYNGNWYVLIPEENRGKLSKDEFTYNKDVYSEGQWTFGEEEQVTVSCWSVNSDVSYIGFADNTPTMEIDDNTWDFYSIPDTPGDTGINVNSGGGDAFKIEWALDPETFEPVTIDKISKIKISTAKYYKSDYTLEPSLRYQLKSTEVDAIVRVSRK